jgi:RNA polymerase sigma-70 factor (ECF subfamily)
MRADPEHRPGAECLDRLRHGSAEALDELLGAYWGPLLSYARHFCGESADVAEDFVQEAFVRLWERRAGWQAGSSPAPILYTLVRNLALKDRRDRKTRGLLLRLQGLASRGGPRPDRELEGQEVGAAIDRAVEALPERRREIFRLTWLHGLSYAETAEVMGITARTVANQMSSALRELREALEPLLEHRPGGGHTRN